MTLPNETLSNTATATASDTAPAREPTGLEKARLEVDAAESAWQAARRALDSHNGPVAEVARRRDQARETLETTSDPAEAAAAGKALQEAEGELQGLGMLRERLRLAEREAAAELDRAKRAHERASGRVNEILSAGRNVEHELSQATGDATRLRAAAARAEGAAEDLRRRRRALAQEFEALTGETAEQWLARQPRMRRY